VSVLRNRRADTPSSERTAAQGAPLREEIPAEVRRLAREVCGGEPELLYASDLSLTGEYEPSWLVADGRSVAALGSKHGQLEALWVVPLNEVRQFETEKFIGSAVLRVCRHNGSNPPLRFSLTKLNEFEHAREELERLRRASQQDSGDAGPLPSSRRCPKCHQVIPAWADECPECKPKGKLLLRVFAYLLPHWGLALVTLALLLVVTALSLAPPYFTKVLIDDVFTKGRPFAEAFRLLLLVVFGGILGTSVLSSALGALRAYLMAYLGARIIIGMKQQLYAHLHRLSMGFYDQQQTGSLMYRVNSDTGRLQFFIANGLQNLLRDVTEVIVISVILFKMHWILAIVVLVPLPLIVWASRAFGKKIHRIYHRVWRIGSQVEAVIADALPGIRVVKAFDKDRYEVRRFASKQHDAFRASMQASLLSNTFWPALGLLTMASTLTIWGYGGTLVLTSHGQALTVGALIAFLTYAGRFYEPVNQLAQMNDQLQVASTSAERVFEILDARPDIADREDAVTLKDPRGEIEFDGIYFAYGDNDPVLKDLTFTIHPGEMVGVVGPSGSGKTTLINLICRFYEVTQGAIKLDGVDLRDVAVHSLRQNVGVVLQEPYLFQGTIAENIAYGRPDASREEMLRATEAAYALDIILKEPDGFDTLVGERGIRLSGGQKQRLSIARAILKNPKVLILDEATSAVDSETEDRIRRAIESLVENRTTIAIAHRLSTLRHASRIAVLSKGELLELGTIEELLELDGLFARHWTKQMTTASKPGGERTASVRGDKAAADAPLEKIARLTPQHTALRTKDGTWLSVAERDQVLFEKLKPARAYPLTAPSELILFCDHEDNPKAFLPEARALDHESYEALDRCLFWRYFVPTILEIQDLAKETDSTTRWEVVTNRGPHSFLVKARHDVRSIIPRRLLLTDSQGNRYDVPDYGELPVPSQALLERMQVV